MLLFGAVRHGGHILAALDEAELTEDENEMLVRGARTGMVLYLRMAEWALDERALAGMVSFAAK